MKVSISRSDIPNGFTGITIETTAYQNLLSHKFLLE